MRKAFPILLGLGALASGATSGQTLPPRYDRVVILVVENVSYGQLIGSPDAPYINSLAAQGASLSGMYTFTHESSPNYGELFAGFHNGMRNTNPPADAPLTTPNLGASLRQAGLSFGGYSESQPEIGSTIWSAEPYARRHNPWVNWQNDAPDAHPNQLPSTTNLRFLDFPASNNYAALPTVSIVVPNNDNNMHNGSSTSDRLQRGDDWARDNIDPYIQWAKTHNSLLIITADEDDPTMGGGYGRIPTILVGPNVKAGVTLPQTYTLHNILRTVEDVYGVSHSGMANNVRPMVGPFVGDPTVNTTTFRNGLNAYAGAKDTQVRAAAPSTSYAASIVLSTDLDDDAAAGNQSTHALLRFDDLFGVNPGQIPADATILNAKLTLWTTDTGNTVNPVKLHRMLQPWSDTSTWNSLGNGVSADEVEASATVDFTYAPPNNSHPFFWDVSDTVQKWVDGAANYGWTILPTGADGYDIVSTEGPDGARPSLEVSYALYPRFTAAGGSWAAGANWANGVPGGPAAVARFLSRPAATNVTLDGDKTVGTLLFDSPGSYTVSPGTGGTLKFANYGNTTTLQVKQGQHTIGVPLQFNDPGRIDVAAAAQVTANAGLQVASGKSLQKTGAGVAQVSGGLSLQAGASLDVVAGELRTDRITGAGGLTVRSGATARLTAIGQASKVTSLSVAGFLDVGQAALVIDYDTASPLTTIANVGSAALATTPGTSIGIAEASIALQLAAGQTTTFMGQTVDSSSLLIRFTRSGDANLDATVNFADLTLLAQNYNTTPGPGGWVKGDFNYDGQIDFADLVMLAQNYNTALPATAVPGGLAGDWELAREAGVPEPVAVALVAFALPFFARGRRGIK